MELEELKNVIKNEDWCVEEGYSEGVWELRNCSPLGEDLSFTVTHNGDPERAVEEIHDFAYNFDVDEHAEPLIEIRGTHGVPDSIAWLIEDAEEIQDMLNSLERACLDYQRTQKAIA